MISWKIIKEVLWGKPPPFRDTVIDEFEDLPPEGLTMGSVFFGRAGTGKTEAVGGHIVDSMVSHPNRAIFVLDWSGSITDSILRSICQLPNAHELLNRVIYDELGNSEMTVPLPEFSTEYGISFEEQIQTVCQNMANLSNGLDIAAPWMAGLSFKQIAPEVFKLITAVTDDQGNPWQITETKRFLLEEPFRNNAISHFGNKVPSAKYFFEVFFKNLRADDKLKMSYAILGMLEGIEPVDVRAKVGYPIPGWTPKEAIENANLVIVDGAKLIGRENSQYFLFTQIYSKIIAQINKRRPGNPEDKPVALVLDEIRSLLEIPGLAKQIASIPNQYRSRKLQLYIVVQNLDQLAEELRRQVWSFGNIVCFAMSSMDDAYEIAKQIFRYDPSTVKATPKSEHSQPVIEPDRGQYLSLANKIQRMPHRECLIRLFNSEKGFDSYIHYVPKTKERPQSVSVDLESVKHDLLRRRAVNVSDALRLINSRKLTIAGRGRPRL